MAIKASASITLSRVNDGAGIDSTVITYQAGESQTTVPSGVWINDIPKLTPDKPYLWTKTLITYTNGESSESFSVSSTLDSFDIGVRNLIRNSKTMIYERYTLVPLGPIVNTYVTDEYGNRLTDEMLNRFIY